ncbi:MULTISPECIES: DUF904 domain-containing protein [Helicobacter]|uniref:DUF904 domain-containing protein n=2 Tax=Helicobacter TaxID=209 RepID=A0A377J4H2_9HELI|nr:MULTISPECIES: DUF904 domain-containing protein [Helicobacter]MDL0080701.1 DUF904 domain-containing protein [Helicobacter sp. CPD2-1]MDL0082639.1 DUF904 domain-containing protein [Helicobacter sp. XJK30-2]STO97164.1 Uncharacterised protein [Helicobacter canis]
MPSITQLEEKISALLAAYDSAMIELESLRKELNTLKAESSQKDLQISALYEEIGNRDRAVESLYDKISTTLASKQTPKADDE